MRLAKLTALVLGAILCLPTIASADIIAQWNFNTSSSPSVGSGTLSTIGGTTSNLQQSNANVTIASSDPTAGINKALRVTNYPAQGTNSGTAGIDAFASTAGLTNIKVTFDSMFFPNAIKDQEFQYTTNGGATWTVFDSYDASLVGAKVWDNGRTYDLTGVAGVGYNSQFGVRLVSVFGDGSNYLATSSGSAADYDPTFSSGIYYDMFTISGQAVPEPGTMAVSGIAGLVGLVGFMRRKKKAKC